MKTLSGACPIVGSKELQREREKECGGRRNKEIKSYVSNSKNRRKIRGKGIGTCPSMADSLE